MIAHPADYTWSRYQHNGAGKVIELITEHDLYTRLGANPKYKQAQYRALFERGIPPYTLEEIKTVTDKMWVLGNDKFKQQVEEMSGRRASPLPKGGDRKSEAFLKSKV